MGVALPEGYAVRPARIQDAAALAAAYARNREHLAPYDPPRSEDFYTAEGQHLVLAERLAGDELGLGVTWVLAHGDEIVGRVALNNIVRGPFRSASLGYWVDHRHTGRGVATAAVQHACESALELGLHRLEAGTLVDNEASQAVLRRCGFVLFGTAPDYLFIDGAWRDHRLFQRILHVRPL